VVPLAITRRIVPKIKNRISMDYSNPLSRVEHQADRAKSARQRGAVRTAGGVGEVTLPACQVAGRALHESDRQHVLAAHATVAAPLVVDRQRARSAQDSGRTPEDAPTVCAPAENTRHKQVSSHKSELKVISDRHSEVVQKNDRKIGDMQVDPYSLSRTPINVINLGTALTNYPDRQSASDIQKGFTEGYKLGYIGEREFRECKNLKSAYENKEAIREKVTKELAAGRIAGPSDTPIFPNMRCSPLGLVPKKDTGDFRMIHHLSYPSGDSINDQIDPNKCSVKYAKFDDAISLIQLKGDNCLLAKCDVKSAFRLMPIHPSDFELLGFKLDNKYYVDKSLPMGCSVSCSTWVQFSTFLEWFLKLEGGTGSTMHYLDDFLFVGLCNSEECRDLLNEFHKICGFLGVPIAHEKTEGPVTKLVFLGLEINTIEETVTIPEAKLNEMKQKINRSLSRKKLSLKELQSIIGSLNFACRAVAPGRAFIRRLINGTKGISASHHMIRVNKGMRADLATWDMFLSHFNGVSVFRDRLWLANSDIEFFTDSAASIGMGIFVNGQWAQEKWGDNFPQEVMSNNITFLELFPIVVALEIFGKAVENKKVLFHCDNAAVCDIINSQTSKCERVMDLVRPMVLRCLKLNTFIKAQHIPGVKNIIADALSRFQMGIFHENAPRADPFPTKIPRHLWHL